MHASHLTQPWSCQGKPDDDSRSQQNSASSVQRPVLDFPLRCDEPFEGEDQTYVLYGSGGCTLYDARKLQALGGFCEVYEPAYVEDLDDKNELTVATPAGARCRAKFEYRADPGDIPVIGPITCAGQAQ